MTQRRDGAGTTANLVHSDGPKPNTELSMRAELMPAGELVTVPVPVPFFETPKETGGPTKMSNCALTVVAALTVTTHVPVPEQPPPLHPAKVEPAAGVAVNVTTVPG